MCRSKKLTQKQRKFAEHYAKTGNATESYKKAGYSANTDRVAGVEGHKLLKNPKIQEHIKELNEKVEKKSIATMEEIKELWTRFARDEAEDKRTRLKATEYLAKTNGAFLDRVEAKVSTNKLEDFFEK